MINIQRVMKDMKKLAEETSMTVTEIEGTILMASINNHTTNATNITQMAEVTSDIISYPSPKSKIKKSK